jgi:signal transduction histidine kinase
MPQNFTADATIDNSVSSRSLRIVQALSGVLGVLATTVLIGWAADVDRLKSIVPGLTAMNPTTAVCFLLLGAVLWIAADPIRAARSANQRLIRLLSGVIVFIALCVLTRYLTDMTFAIDQILFHDRLTEGERPNRMAPNTVAAMLLLSAGVPLLVSSRTEWISVGQLLAVLGGFIGTLALLGYVYGAQPLYGMGPFIPMALHTALGLCITSYALLCLRSRGGWVAELNSPRMGGVTARRLLPAALFVPAVIGWVRLMGEQRGWYDSGTGVAMMALSTMGLFGIFVFGWAVLLNRIDARREIAEQELHRLNAELHAHAGELESINEELESFSYSVSHDLRAPLRHISGFADLLKKGAGTSLDEKNARYLDIINISARQMGRLIDDLLAFSRTGRTTMRYIPVNLRNQVDEVIRDLEPETKDRAIVWRIGELPLVNADPSLLRQVWINLLSNAVKYTSSRSEAVIEIGPAPGKETEHVIFVRDNGVGFDMKYSGKLFGVFQRLHNSTDFEGTGIGLATVRRIVSRHRGRVWAEAAVNQGATFYFSLPKPTPQHHDQFAETDSAR